MSALREVQGAFAEAMLGTGTIAGLEQGRLSAEIATEIYRNNVRGNALNALQAAFPALRALLGEGCFEATMLLYLRAHPSGSGDLHDLGAELPGFLSTVAEFDGLAYLPDIARLEWLQRRSLIAEDAEPFDFSGLADVAEGMFGSLRFLLAPAVCWLRSPWPVFSIWRLARSEAAGEEGADIDLEQGGEQALVYRHGAGTVLTESLSPGAAQLLQAIGEGRGFAEACDLMWMVDPGADVGAYLREFVGKGVVCGWCR